MRERIKASLKPKLYIAEEQVDSKIERDISNVYKEVPRDLIEGVFLKQFTIIYKNEQKIKIT